MAGVHAEIRGVFAQSAQNYITASRIWQGNDEILWSTPEERHDIEIRWGVQKSHLKSFYALKQRDRLKNKGKGKEITSPDNSRPVTTNAATSPPPTGLASASTTSLADQMSVASSQQNLRQSPYAPYSSGTILADSRSSLSRDEDDVFERAILNSIRQTSRGDATEDARVEQAVRTGVELLRRRSQAMGPRSTNSLASAAASIISSEAISETRSTSVSVGVSGGAGPAGSATTSSSVSTPAPAPSAGQAASGMVMDDKRTQSNVFDDLAIDDEEYQSLIEQAVHMSMNDDGEHGSWGIRMHDTEEADVAEEEELKKVLARSQADSSRTDEELDEDYKKALADSEAAHAARLQNLDRTNEEEEELRKAIEASQAEEQKRPSASQGDDEEELRRALEESQKIHEQEVAQSKTIQSDEEKVLEYVKQQSIAEEAARKQKGKERGGDGIADEEDDDELKKAIEQSMQEWQSSKGQSGGGSGDGGSGGAGASGSGSGSKTGEVHELEG